MLTLKRSRPTDYYCCDACWDTSQMPLYLYRTQWLCRYRLRRRREI